MTTEEKLNKLIEILGNKNATRFTTDERQILELDKPEDLSGSLKNVGSITLRY